MIHRLAETENNQCLYFALLGALQHSGRAMQYDHRTLKEAILNHMVTNSSKANYFINSAGAYRVERDCPDERFETLQEALRAEPHIGFPFNEPFTTMERYRQVGLQFAFAVLRFDFVAGHVTRYGVWYPSRNNGRCCIIPRPRHRVDT